MAPRLRVEFRGIATEVPLGGERATVGRSNRCTVALPFPGVADVQFRIERREGAFRLKDDGSGIETRVNGKPVFSTALAHGDVIEAGDLRCVFLEEEAAAAPAPPVAMAARPRRARLLAALAVFPLAAAVAFLLLRDGGDAPDAALLKTANGHLRAAAESPARAREELDAACAALEALLDGHPRSPAATTARLSLESARRARDDLATLERETADPVDAADAFYERIARYKKNPHPAVVARAVRRQWEFEEALAGERKRCGAAAAGEAAARLKDRRYADARRAYDRLGEKAPALREEAERGARAVDDAARRDYEAMVAAAERTPDLDARIGLLEANREAFRGTRHAEDLEVRISAARARRSPVPEAPPPVPTPKSPEAPVAPPKETGPYADPPAIADLVHARRYGEAAAALFRASAHPLAKVRVEELTLLAALRSDLVAAVKARPEGFREIEIRQGVRRDAAGADDASLLVRSTDGEAPVPWESVPAPSLARLLRLAGLAKPPRLAFALLLDEEGLRDDAERAYAECVAAGAETEALTRILARRRGIEPPAGGFVAHEGRAVTPAERDALVLASRLARLEADAASGDARRRAGAFDALEGLGEPAREALLRALSARATAAGQELGGLKAFSREHAVAALGGELQARRAFALAFILDAKQYPYPNPPPGAQEEAERRVQLVRDILEKPFAMLAKGSERGRELDRELSDLDARLARVDPAAAPLGDEARARAVADLDLAHVAFDHRDKERLEYNASVARYNRELKETSIGEEERANVEAVNEYRSLMGLLAVKIDERLVRAARKHSIEMAQLDYFAHESPTPSLKTPAQRARRDGYGGGVAENIARGPATGRDAFLGWFRSSGHHRNMLQPGHTDLGCGECRRHYWTQLFGGLSGKSLDAPKVPADPDPPGTSGNGKPPLE